MLAAALQSATVKRGDMSYDRRRRRFAFVCNRFRWEDETRLAASRGGSRIRAGVQINDVAAVRALGIGDVDEETVLELLSIEATLSDDLAGTLVLHFAGGGAASLEVGCIDVLVDDMGRPWYTPNRPDHGVDTGPAEEG